MNETSSASGIYGQRRSLGRVVGLDGIRAIAIAAVMLYHAVDRFFRGGFFGVDVFFVLSAFLITSLVLDEVSDRDGGYRFREFYWRRGFRLAPALVLWLVILAGPTTALHGSIREIAVWSAGSLFYVANFLVVFGVPGGEAYAHAWSLAVEEQFYLLWPVALVFLARTQRLRSSMLFLTALFAVAIGIQVGVGSATGVNYFLLTGHLVPLAAGAMAAVAIFLGGGGNLRRWASTWWAAAGALLVIAALVLGFRPGHGAGVDQLSFVAATLATVTLVLHVCDRPVSTISQLLSWAPLVWLGRRSYGLYLYHRTLAILVPQLLPGWTLRVLGPLVIVAALVLAELSFRYVERPLQLRGRAWRRRRATTSFHAST